MRMQAAAFCAGLCLSMVLGGALWASGVFAQSSEVTQLQAEIAERNDRLKDIEAEIAAYKSELQKVGAEKNTLQKAINQLELERKKISADIAYTQNRIGSTDLEINKLSLEIGDMEIDIDSNKNAIGEMLRRLNEQQNETLLVSLLREGNLANFWNAVDGIEDVKNALGTRVKELASLKTLLEAKRGDEHAKRSGLVKLKEQYADQQEVLINNKEEKNDLLAETKNKESEYQALLKQREEERARFEREIQEFESRLQFILDPNSIPSPGSGVLAWPLDGVRVTQYFGDTAFARSGGYNGRGHNGIDLGAARGTAVKAALAGKVTAVNVQVAPMCQYGKWVLVKHANGLTTLYAHLSLVSVNQGDDVATGDIIGYSGDTGYAIGPHLHFTVYASQAVNFTQYTCNSGIKLTIPVSAPSGYLNPMSYLPPVP
jgi:murein DD-endopeptidase MepM/ murein hydrolase activator NlpD